MRTDKEEREESCRDWLKAGDQACAHRTNIADSLQEQAEGEGCPDDDQAGHGKDRHEVPGDGVIPYPHDEPQDDAADDESVSND